ncbi:hypothetical protein ABT297_05505 [Dactylosporangium sp. NPDC000555]|uniref:hypothetical protein n=1 Tax=Dactylosporangium sp. NPDC000555 TaxID=3154260 RepID=UPI00332A0E1B
MKSLPRQFQSRYRLVSLPVRTGAVSAVVLSATLFATGSAGRPPAVHPPVAAAASAYAYDAALVSPLLDGTAAVPAAEAPPAASATTPAMPIMPAAPTTPTTPTGPTGPAMPQPPRPVAGLDQTQMNNAVTIVRQGRAQGLPTRALVVAVATAMQESDLYNVASRAVPASLKLPHEGVSQDHDSVGLFQQRASQGWGTVPELMNPVHSAMLFYKALTRVKGWQNMSVTAAAQAVQRSAFPGAYQKHAARAEKVVAAID